VAYAKELFGSSVAGYACVYTGDANPADSSVGDEVVPQLVEHMKHGQAAAILKAFYERLSQQRFEQLARQAMGLLKSVSRSAWK